MGCIDLAVLSTGKKRVDPRLPRYLDTSSARVINWGPWELRRDRSLFWTCTQACQAGESGFLGLWWVAGGARLHFDVGRTCA